jgi:hypothetical protein
VHLWRTSVAFNLFKAVNAVSLPLFEHPQAWSAATSPRIFRAPAIAANGTSMTATDHCCSALASTDNTCSSTQNGSW